MLEIRELPAVFCGIECHTLALPDGCCPVSKNPMCGSTISIVYKPHDVVLDVLSIPAYLRSYRGGLRDEQGSIIVRDMEGMIDRVAGDCCAVLRVPVRVYANLLLAPKQHMIVRARRYPSTESEKPVKNWNEPEMSPVYLATGEQVYVHINGISPDDGSGHALIGEREINVAPLPTPWQGLGYGEVVTITLQSGKTIISVLTPEEYTRHTAYLFLDAGADATICLLDKSTGQWREMTGDEYDKERRAMEADMRDMAQIEREWREYRNEGLGERG